MIFQLPLLIFLNVKNTSEDIECQGSRLSTLCPMEICMLMLIKILSCILQKQEDYRALGFSSEMAVRKVREKHNPAHKPALILILYIPTTIFQLFRDGPSWVEPVLS